MKTQMISKTRGYRKVGIPLFILLFGFSFFISPYLALFRFKMALDNSDHVTLNSMIAFSSLRTSLKKQIKAPLARKFKQRIGSNLFSDLGILMAEPIVNSIVDSTTTPRGIKLLLNNGILSNSNTSNNHIKPNISKLDDFDKDKEQENKISLFYTNLNRFVLSSDTNNTNQPVKAYWQRSNLFDWKLISVEIPVEILDQY